MKQRICRIEGCGKEAAKFFNSSINNKYCTDHAIEQAIEKSRLNQLKQAKKERSEKVKQTRQKKVDLMSVDEYRAKYVQPLINEIARLIDYGHPCIASGCFGKMNAGHYIATGANRTLTLNLHNIHIQSFESNHHKSGDNLRYRQGLINTYGLDYLEKVEALKQLKPIKLTKDDLKEVKHIAGDIVKELKAYLQVKTPEQRIQAREYYNKQLGIY